MSLSTVYRDLAGLAGIETRYRDAWGQEREVSRETIEALLAAMGLAAGSEAEAERRLSELSAARWHELLEPVTVLLETDPIAVKLRLPEGAGDPLTWRIAEEEGGEHTGTVSLADCRMIARAEFAGSSLAEYELELPTLALGYHFLTVRWRDREATASLIVAPSRCYLPEALAEGGRAWALTTQLYSLRSARNWGMGDFSDLGRLARGAARHGAQAVGVNPLHALFPAEPRHISPYSPSSRLFLNDLYIDPEAVPDFAESEEAHDLFGSGEVADLLAKARSEEFVDHVAVAAAKRRLFTALYRSFRSGHLGGSHCLSERGRAFREYQRVGGDVLRNFATFTALQYEMLDAGLGFSWKEWPIALRDPGSEEVANFVAQAHERVEEIEYLQWEADRQLGAAARGGLGAGLAIGLYRDLAVGVDPSGAEAWSMHDILISGATIGAPPDLLNLRGQNWGLVPTAPLALRRRAMRPLIACLRANMRHAGAVRIDHVMGLQRLYWIPQGMAADQGAYVGYPLEESLRILALESHRHGCAVIGEDLGTVPEGFRERMHEEAVLSYRVLFFERDQQGAFMPPERYPELAAATVSTHDIATLRGYWQGRDIEWRRNLGLYPSDEHWHRDIGERIRDRRLLIEALRREDLLSPEAAVRLLSSDPPRLDFELTQAVHAYIGRSASRFALAQIEDMVGEIEQPNLPGTVDEHPNWRRKLALTIEEILEDAGFRELAATLVSARRESAARWRGRNG